jgi:uncharacterized membrane protein
MAISSAVMAKFQNPSPTIKAVIDLYHANFANSEFVGVGATKTGGTAYVKFSIPAIQKFRLMKCSVNVRSAHLNNMRYAFWHAWTDLRAENLPDEKRRLFRQSWNDTWNDDSKMKRLIIEAGVTHNHEFWEAFFDHVGLTPTLQKALQEVKSSAVVQDKRKNHEVKTALQDIRGPLRILLRHGIETEQLHEMINHEIVDLITNG